MEFVEKDNTESGVRKGHVAQNLQNFDRLRTECTNMPQILQNSQDYFCRNSTFCRILCSWLQNLSFLTQKFPRSTSILAYLHVVIATEVYTCCNGRCTLQWISQQPMMIGWCFNFSNTLAAANECPQHQNLAQLKRVVFYVLVTI